jgi:hypothetical protein
MEENTNTLEELVRKLLVEEGYKADDAIKLLVKYGISEDIATNCVHLVVQQNTDAIFEKRQEIGENESREEIGYWGIAIASLILPIFGIKDTLLCILLASAAAIIAYYAYPKKPIAVMIPTFLFTMLFPFTYEWYLSGRTKFFYIEILIPAAILIIPLYIMHSVLKSIIYPNEN